MSADLPPAVQKLFDAMNSRKGAGMADLFVEDAEFHMPFAPDGGVIKGKAAILGLITGTAFNTFDPLKIEIIASYPMRDPDMFAVEYKSDGKCKPTGRPYRNTYVSIVRLRGGKIALWKEYFNPLAVMDATGADAAALFK